MGDLKPEMTNYKSWVRMLVFASFEIFTPFTSPSPQG
jgi:hypothetical protein